MKLQAIGESIYADLSDEDEFEFPQECSKCGLVIVGEEFSTCQCSETFCFPCLKRELGKAQPGFDPRIIWRFNYDKDERGNRKRDPYHLWQCQFCYNPPFQLEESYEGLPDEDEFENENVHWCYRCDMEISDNEAYTCECGATYCERCTVKDEMIEFDDGYMVCCPDCVSTDKLRELGYSEPFIAMLATRQFRRFPVESVEHTRPS